MPGIEKQKKIHEEILELNLSLEEYKRLKEKYTDKESELNKFIKINGSLENLSEKEKKIENEIKTKEQEKEKVSLLGTIIKNSIDYLTESPVEKDKCPVCGSVKDNLLENLQKKYEEKFKEEIGILEKEIKEKKYEKEKIRELKGKAMQFMEEYNRAKQEIEKKGKEIREKHNIPDREDIEKYLNAKINELNGNEEELKTKIDEKQKVLTEIENEIEKFRKIRDILKLKEQIKKSCEIETTDKWNALQKKSDELKKFYEKLQTIVEAVKTASKEEAQSKINSIGDKVSEYFKFMTQHPGIDKLELKVQRDVRTGTNSYSFEDSRGENVTSILSQGHYNSLALSIFLAIANLQDSHPFSFIMFDDPSQSLGQNEKEQFVEILNYVAENKNLIVSTMDNELFKLMNDKLTKEKTIYKFETWDKDKGPTIKKS